MTPEQFIAKWQANTRNEAAASKEHFLNLCDLLGAPSPNSDATGATYAFEKGVTKAAGGGGWADVWKRGCFGWEYKSRGADLNKAHDQLLRYAGALENPPLLVSSDMDRIVVRTNWTNVVSETSEFRLEDLRDAAVRQRLAAMWTEPDRWRPGTTRQALTEKAAGEFADLANRLRARGHDPQAVAHFVIRLVFCLFADDVALLPQGLFDRMLGAAKKNPARFEDYARRLFRAMAERGGEVDFTPVKWFNGGLFDDGAALPLEAADIEGLERAAGLDWSEIDPSILGTLFERGLDPDKRSQLGAHYTDRDKIMRIVEPVVVRPLAEEWEAAKGEVAALLAKAEAAKGASARTKARNDAAARLRTFLDRLRAFRVLDPACGSGNFLYLSLLALKDLEHRAMVEAEALGFQREFVGVGPQAVLGIELNPYAAELARVSVWIGDIQWARRHGYPPEENPILRKLDAIEWRDALLGPDGSEAEWPDADVIIGNPPFLGAKLMYRRLGRPETERIRLRFADRLSGFTDLVCYWFEKSRAQIVAGRTTRVGLVATKSISKNTNLPVLIRISDDCRIFNAWSNEPWVVEGAAVRVSIICFGAKADESTVPSLDGTPVAAVNPDLTAGVDVTKAVAMKPNLDFCFVGIQKSGPLDIPGTKARIWMGLPSNPNGKSNSEVLKPYWDGDDVVGRPKDVWLVDLPKVGSEDEVSLFEVPFEHISEAPYDPPTTFGRSTRYGEKRAMNMLGPHGGRRIGHDQR